MTTTRRAIINLSEAVRDLPLERGPKMRLTQAICETLSTEEPRFSATRFTAHALSEHDQRPSWDPSLGEQGGWRWEDGSVAYLAGQEEPQSV